MLFWTHIFDLLAKLVCLVFPVVLARLCTPRPLPAIEWVLLILSLSMLAGGVLWWTVLRTLSSWLHARVRLEAPLTWGQARRASMLFSPVRGLPDWHPLWEVRELPEEKRVFAIEEAIRQLQSERESEDARWKEAGIVAHVLRWGCWLSVVVIGVVTVADLPPASWMSELQVHLFGGYYPMLNFALMALVVIVPLRILETAFRPSPAEADPSSQTHEAAAPLSYARPSASDVPSLAKPKAAVSESAVSEKTANPDDYTRFAPPSELLRPRGE